MGATGGFTDMNTAGNALTSVLERLRKERSQAAQVVDQFITTQNQGKIVVQQYSDGIGKVASATLLGVN